MLKKSILTTLIIIITFTACKNKKETDTKVEDLISINDFDSIAIQKLPYAFAFDKDSILDYHYTLEAFEQNGKIDKNAKLNTYFSDSTAFLKDEDLMITESKNYPYIGEGYFYTRLPNINDIKVLIFTYHNTEEPETLPYFELQTFNENNKVVDKLILAGGINYDCSWDRQFSIDKDYNIIIIDNESCFDPEDEKQILTKTVQTQYKIGNDGQIEQLISEEAV
ncbi:hypothetical protein UMM65_03300 [Aureibaculum sp. 2210JD6-5]|uniref:hypothetical protein n=1 Tax=Aureibaculum sp. 2210JD6-5 TaxID=3103957 RepID=UPI002AAD2648|nr:hypothetical protein [Aureibaculum sp. 2210JD6-5]MDY7394253.1 hypothetical protein [Aureibaculum sp. 2210JD6-5]